MDLKRVIGATALNPIVGDLELDETGDLVWLRPAVSVTDYVLSVAQTLKARLRFPKNTWYLNKNEGIPYLESLMEKGVSDATWRVVCSKIMLDTPGIAVIDSLIINTNGRTRTKNLDFRTRLDTGEILTSSMGGPFVLDLGALGSSGVDPQRSR